jgi:hypothetical protein
LVTISRVWLLFGLSTMLSVGHADEKDSKFSPISMYARAAIIEFCQKSDIRQCPVIAANIVNSRREIFTHGVGSSRQYLVVFAHTDGYWPFVILALDKDGWIKVVARGVHFDDKKKFIETFKAEGNFAQQNKWGQTP